MRFLADWWRSMGRWRWLNVLPLIVALGLALRYEAMPLTWMDQGSRDLGNMEVRLETRGPVRAGELLPVRLTLSRPGTIQVGFSTQAPAAAVATVTASNQSLQTESRIQVPATSNDRAVVIVSHDQQSARWTIGRLIL